VTRQATESSPTIQSLQALRFLAACLVLFSHIEERLLGFAQRQGADVVTLGFSGDLGVRIFFVISGFLMMRIGQDQFGRPGATGRFFRDRVTRVVPLYWVMTLLQLAFLRWAAMRGDADAQVNGGWHQGLMSLLFVPYQNGLGAFRPVLEQGWTLNYEMFFYAVFALCLLLPKRLGLVLAFGGLLLLIAAGPSVPESLPTLHVWTRPLMLEFVLGMALAQLRAWTDRRHSEAVSEAHALPRLPGLLLWILGLVFGAHLCMRQPSLAVVAPTLAAVATVTLCVFARDMSVQAGWQRWLVRQGSASYSLYLTHGFCLLVVGIAWRKLFGGAHMAAYVACCILLSLWVAQQSWRQLEIPMTRMLRRRPVPVVRLQPK